MHPSPQRLSGDRAFPAVCRLGPPLFSPLPGAPSLTSVSLPLFLSLALPPVSRAAILPFCFAVKTLAVHWISQGRKLLPWPPLRGLQQTADVRKGVQCVCARGLRGRVAKAMEPAGGGQECRQHRKGVTSTGNIGRQLIKARQSGRLRWLMAFMEGWRGEAVKKRSAQVTCGSKQ